MFGGADYRYEDFSPTGLAARTVKARTVDRRVSVRASTISIPSDFEFTAPTVRRPLRIRREALAPARLLDLAVAAAALVFFAPIMVMVAVAIRASGRGPILFRQKRVGIMGRRFDCFKFRTMRHDAESVLAKILAENPSARVEWSRVQKLRNDPRISRLGKFLRKTSLDELPQLLNVFRGDMSVVGPRPIVAEEIERYGRYFRDYAAVKPGLTGIWQISGRNDVSYRRRIACDVSYARSKTVIGDVAILAKTIPVLLFARGAY